MTLPRDPIRTGLRLALALGALTGSACSSAPATPTRIPTATASRTPTPAPTATPTPVADLRLAEQADGSNVLFDVRTGYQLTTPRDWVAHTLSAADLDQAMQAFASDPNLAGLLQFLAGAQAEPRLLAYPRAVDGVFPAIGLSVAIRPGTLTMGMDELVLLTAAGITLANPDVQVLSTYTQVNPQGVELGGLDLFLPVASQEPGVPDVTARLAAFTTQDTLVLVSLVWQGGLMDIADQVWPGILASISLDPQ